MQKISAFTSTATDDGLFTNGSVSTGVSPTILDAGWFNAVQNEIVAVIQAAGLTLSGDNSSQLLAGLAKLTLQRSNPFGDIASDGSASVVKALANISLLNKTSFSSSDFIRIPDVSNGLIIQWAKIKSGSAGTYTWTYPTPFPNARLAVWGMVHRTNVSGTDSATIAFDDQLDPTPLTLSNFNLRVNGAAGANAAFVLAIGN